MMGEESCNNTVRQADTVEQAEAGPSLVFDGLLLRAPAGRVHLVSGQFCLEFDESDIIEIRTSEPGAAEIESFAIPVRLHLRAGARLWMVCDSEIYHDLLYPDRRPCAISSRKHRPPIPDSPRYRSLEAEFLRERGIERVAP